MTVDATKPYETMVSEIIHNDMMTWEYLENSRMTKTNSGHRWYE
jgi:hypothetical protein